MTLLLPLSSRLIIPFLLTELLKLAQLPLLLIGEMVQVSRKPFGTGGLRRRRGGVVVVHGLRVLLVNIGIGGGVRAPEGHFGGLVGERSRGCFCGLYGKGAVGC